ncbi:hypothetical protein [Paludibacterium paludis]|uniref:Uncharacterized protein n=1 Tax=Paludibacterium paludis TaxID=1225769 RepID=A0A918NYY8_9NEIS|nr:hypothetical protein [Paludibacterium paludis]GGY06736.1 hypothetical protein GCM10011289_06600 [Paludibacterium paludis]
MRIVTIGASLIALGLMLPHVQLDEQAPAFVAGAVAGYAIALLPPPAQWKALLEKELEPCLGWFSNLFRL